MVLTRMMCVHLPYSLPEWRESPLNLPPQVSTCFCPSGSPVPSLYVYPGTTCNSSTGLGGPPLDCWAYSVSALVLGMNRNRELVIVTGSGHTTHYNTEAHEHVIWIVRTV